MATNEVFLLSVRGVVSETQHVHTLHFLANDPLIDEEDIVAGWQATSSAFYRGMFSTGHSPVQAVKCQKVCGTVPLPTPWEVVPPPGDQLGTRVMGGTEPMPAYVAAVVAERGALAGRRYSGRFFIGGLYETDVNGNLLTTAYMAMVQAYINALKTAYVTPATPPFQLQAFSNLLADGDPNHTKRNPNPPPERIADPVDSVPCQNAGSRVRDLIVNVRPTTMRSRKVGHGL